MIFKIKKTEYPVDVRETSKSTPQLKKEFKKGLRSAKKADKLNHREIGEKHWNKLFRISDELMRRSHF